MGMMRNSQRLRWELCMCNHLSLMSYFCYAKLAQIGEVTTDLEVGDFVEL